ncbi:Auxin-responsive protein SAUR32 [Capsicum baccatum]|uniref:Auxin-responsive protein SAUR32 n=1 Tax=Capsicum baccatum TaxID=33114 RepID=A0A2G2XKY5_CAPBA|nr:Auxin-responsive protein SAUR32 [Capsicum baccatum]
MKKVRGSKVRKCLQFLKHGAKRILNFGKTNSGYFRVGQEPKNRVSVPKGHLAVYVGEQEDDTCRVVVPVIYFNHPLFAELLREAEMVYGYNYSGGIQIPCRISEFENVKSRIAATGSG